MAGPILPLNTGSLAIVAMPQMLKALIKRLRHKEQVLEESSARQEFSFDQAFTLVKFFLERATEYTVEDVQRFGNTTVPSPWWVRVVRVVIPSSQCDEAGQLLARAFGPDELDGVVGGERWWQRRGQKEGGVEGEWIAMKTDWKNVKMRDSQGPHLSGATSRTNPHARGGNNYGSEDGKGKEKEEVGRPRRGTWKEEVGDAGDKKAQKKAEKANVKAARKMFHRAASEEKSRQKDVEKARHRALRKEKKEERQNEKRRKGGALNPKPDAEGFATDEETDIEAGEGLRPNGDAQPKTEDEKMAEGIYHEDMDEMRCMLYIHGGGYYFGSVNTHRYTIWRYCRKMAGRAFAVSYRLSPQYPFPCALADCLASYLYLIRPPVGAKHRPVDPSKLIIAGDSAGGGLSLALLTLIRDLGLPAPAGGVLISPWCDLTHSFPSILQNTKTDIIPPYGFMHQPSELWPPPSSDFADAQRTQLEHKDGKLVRTETPMHSSSSKPDGERGDPATDQPERPVGTKEAEDVGVVVNEDGEKEDAKENGRADDKKWENPFTPAPHGESLKLVEGKRKEGNAVEPHKVVQIEVNGKEIDIAEQIQLYATNDQLTHPFCSPALAPSLGGLPPLLVIAGDKEVLRDEIIYIAHRAAHPDRYPLREELLNAHPNRASRAKDFPPTKVHLQVYDGMCHVLPLFSFTTPAKYCYRAIASFCKFVSTDNPEAASPVSPTGMELPVNDISSPHSLSLPLPREQPRLEGGAELNKSASASPGQSTLVEGAQEAARVTRQKSRSVAGTASTRGPHPPKTKLDPRTMEDLKTSIYHANQPFSRPDYKDNMIRERIDVHGRVRPLEPESELQGLQLKPEEIGVIKEGPIKRWLEGRSKWDKKFGKKYERIEAARKRNVKRSNSEEARRLKVRVQKKRTQAPRPITEDLPITASPEDDDNPGQSWALPGERPPPSSIAARRDTVEALKLAKAVDLQHESRHMPHPLAVWANINEVPEEHHFGPERRPSDEVEAKP